MAETLAFRAAKPPFSRGRKAGAAEERNGRKQVKLMPDLKHVRYFPVFPAPIQRGAVAVVPTTWRGDLGVRLWAHDAHGGRIRNRFAEAFAAQIFRRRIY